MTDGSSTGADGGPPQALIMAGGEGSRLRPLTSGIPKPMLPVCNRPLMEHIIKLLRRHGLTDIVATVQFLSSVIRNHFDDGSELGVSLSYSTEETPLGTAGSVLNARDLLSGRFLVISGDALTDIDLTDVLDFHRRRGATATMVLKRMQDPLEFGIVMTGEEGRIERFLEKPSWGQVFTDTVNTGIYVLEPEVLDLIPPDQPYDFSSELFPAMLDKGLPLYGYIAEGYWTDVGNTAAYLDAQRDALSGRVAVELPGFEMLPRVWVGEDVDIDPTARIEGPAVIGDNSRVGPGAVVGPYTVLGSNAIVDAEARVVGSVVMDRGHVDEMVTLRGTVLGRRATVDRGAVIEEGAVIGDEVEIGADAVIKSQVKIYPSRTVEAGALVTHSVITEQRAQRSLFGVRGVSGLVNVGLTPITAVRLGMAYGTVLKRRSVVVTGRDASRAARTMKRALIAGVNSTGVTCHDLEMTTMPLVRFSVRSGQRAGGVHVRTVAGDPSSVEIRLLDADGSDLPEPVRRRIERVFFREEYRGPAAARIGELEFPPHVPGQYAAGLVASVDLGAIRAASPKVVIDYAFGPAALLGPSIMGRLGGDVLAVNAYTDEHRAVLSPADLDRLLGELAERVRNSGSDAGVLLEPGGEVAHVVDDSGRLLSPHELLLLFVAYEARRGAGTIAVPVSASMHCETLAGGYGVRVVRTATSPAALMRRAAAPGVGFAGDPDGTLIFPSFMPAPDGLMTFAKVLEVISSSGEALSAVAGRLPGVHMVEREVRTPWQLKGAVMRRLAAAGDGQRQLLDGVKVLLEDGWVLTLPRSEQPSCRVLAEAATPGRAAELAERYAAIVQEVVEAERQHSDT